MNTRPRGNRFQTAQGFTLIELLVSCALVATGLTIGTNLFKSSESAAIKARIDGRISALLRYQTEQVMYMPYSTLVGFASAGGLTQTGYLYQPSDGAGGYRQLYAYTLSSTMVLLGAGTASEQVSVTTSIQWSQPPTAFTNNTLVQKQMTVGTHTRYRF